VNAESRARVAAWLASNAVVDPETTAAVLGAAIDGLVMQRALDPALTAGAVGPVLNRMLTLIDENAGGRT